MPIEKNIQSVTVFPLIEGGKHKLIAHYGINQIKGQRPYFTVTGELYEPTGGRFRTEPDLSGKIHDEIAEHLPWLQQLISLHLCDAETGEPMHAVENGWYWYSSDKRIRRGENVRVPSKYACLDAAGRAAAYLGCSPAVFDQMPHNDPEQAKQRFETAVDTLRPHWAALARAARALYRLEGTAEPAQAPYSVNLDAESVREEIQDAYYNGTNPHGHIQEEVENLVALDDLTIGQAIDSVVGDRFWEAFDSTRSDVIARLTSEMESHAQEE